MRKEVQVCIACGERLLDSRSAEDTANSGVGVLGIEHGIFIALLSGKIDVEIHMGVMASGQVEEARDVASHAQLLFLALVRCGCLPEFLNEISQFVNVAISLSHG